MGQKAQKTTPEVADVHHGGLGRVQEGKNGLEGRQTFEDLDPLRQEILLFTMSLL